MAYVAKLTHAGTTSTVTVVDDRGVPAHTQDLPAGSTGGQVDAALRAAGFTRTADWTETANEWQVPVLAATDDATPSQSPGGRRPTE